MPKPPPRSIDRERAARILAEAALVGDQKAADNHGICAKTLRRWRERMATDEQMSANVLKNKRRLEADWADKLPAAIRGAIAFLERASQESDPSDPESVHSVTGALKILTDVAIAKQIVDARLAPQRREMGVDAEEVGTPAGEDAIH